MLPVEIGALPENISIGGLELRSRSSFHVSLLCVKDLIDTYGDNIPDLEQKILTHFCTYVGEKDISFLRYKDVFRLAAFAERKSVIVRCEVSGLDDFFYSLGSYLDVGIPLQPTHVTLYALQPDMGIGLNNSTAMEEKSVSVEVPVDVKRSLGF